ncbi:hypothetical protein QTP86_027805 [Hemibagrus guttatus]|nr:hypothetical protein QTP86_027805 [Hemibagrus guttatus]
MACVCVFVLLLVPAVRCQYEHYSPEDFPHTDLMPLDSAYGFALERYGVRDWAESARYLELSLRLHRLLRESEGSCNRACTRDNLQDPDMGTSLRIIKHILTRAACVKRCKAEMPVFSKKYPKSETLEAFATRTPYRYLQFAYYQVGCELEEKERFWSELDEVMESIPTGERVVIGADFNGHVGEGNTGDEEVMGKFGVKERNLEGQMVVDFAKRMDMAVVNTYFQKREEHRVTYKSGGRSTQVVLPDDWETTAEVIRETVRKVLGVSSGRRKEDKETWWWNEEVQDSIQRKRLAKKKWDMDRTEENRLEYKELQRRVKREVSKAKQKAYDELYTRLDTREGEKDLYRLARQRDRDGKDVQQVRVIKDRDGRVLTSEESVQRRWKEYFEELMNEENERGEKRVEGVNSVEQKVDKIRKDEVRKALKRMKSGKAVGPDDIPVEVWKCLGEAAVELLTSLFNRVLENLEKAYDRVPREELWYCMRKSGVAEKYVRVVQDMYERSRTVVRCAVGQTEEFNVEVGLHQGSALSPFLFAIVMDQLSEEVRQESSWTMMFADDLVICSESREQVEENLERWRFVLERRGMKVSGTSGLTGACLCSYWNTQTMNNLEKAVSAAHTYLQRNPGDPLISKNMNFYKSLFDIEEYLLDQEEKKHETLFLKAVLLYNTGDFSRSVKMMEEVCEEYLRVYDECVSACEGSYEVPEVKDFYYTLAGLFMEVMQCKVKCEVDLTPNVGGFFVEKFVATIYHYMQFAYYKLNDAIKAAQCALSYLLFDPDDQIMQQNVAYYRFHKKQWGLKEEEFTPRPEALHYFNQTMKQKDLLEFARNYLRIDDEDIVSPEESPTLSSPDEEFDGAGDYEESFLAEWWQEPKTKGDTGEAE